MSELVSDLLMHYGSAAVIGAVIAALVIWGLAHFNAAPGTPVKVFWGLVDYTKRLTEASGDLKAPTVASSDLKKPTEASGDPKPANSQPSPGPEELEVSHGLIPDGDLEKIKELRSGHDLRELRPCESRGPVQASPPGTYFFVDYRQFEESRRPVGSENLLDIRTNRLRGSSWKSFEVHHRGAGEFLLLAFLSEPHADRVCALTGDREFQITIAPRSWETFSSLVELPWERIVASRCRLLDVDESTELPVLDATVR